MVEVLQLLTLWTMQVSHRQPLWGVRATRPVVPVAMTPAIGAEAAALAVEDRSVRVDVVLVVLKGEGEVSLVRVVNAVSVASAASAVSAVSRMLQTPADG